MPWSVTASVWATPASISDYALLLDGLKAEREQGITIDVAYRYFSTNNRKFIIADTPGHEQYTRNMITGGSTANLAIILVDARTGVITQTCRHTYLVSLLGIKHVVLAVNNRTWWTSTRIRSTGSWQDYKRFVEPLDTRISRISPYRPWMAITWWRRVIVRLVRGYVFIGLSGERAYRLGS